MLKVVLPKFTFEPPGYLGKWDILLPWKPHPNKAPKRTRNGSLYADPANKREQGRILEYVRLNYPKVPKLHEGPVNIYLYFFYKKEKDWFPGKQKVIVDVDNLAYSVFNALKGHLWIDDDQIMSSCNQKLYWDQTFSATFLVVKLYEPTYGDYSD